MTLKELVGLNGNGYYNGYVYFGLDEYGREIYFMICTPQENKISDLNEILLSNGYDPELTELKGVCDFRASNSRITCLRDQPEFTGIEVKNKAKQILEANGYRFC